MSTLPLILLLVAFIPGPASAPHAQNADVLLREDDDAAGTTHERQSALTMLLTAAREIRDQDPLKAVRFLNRAGKLQVHLSSAREALTSFQVALTILEQNPDPTTKVDCLNGLGLAYNHLSKCDDARTVLQEAIALSKKIGYTAGNAETLLRLSFCQNFGDHPSALRSAQEALTLWQSINNKRGIAESYGVIGQYQLIQNNLVEATQSHQAALHLWRELNVVDEQAESLINLGFIEYRKGAWQDVFAFLTQAQNLLDEQAEPYKMGQISAGIAEAFVESGMPEIGLSKFLQGLEYFRLAGNQRAVISVVMVIGKTYYELGDYAQALTNLQSAHAEAIAIKETTLVAMCNDFLGRTFAATDNQAGALRSFEVALELYEQTGNPMESARMRALIGQIYQQQGRIRQARVYYQSALRSFRDVSDPVNQSAVLNALGRLELKRGNLNIAEDYLRQSLQVTENMRRVSSSRDLTAAFSAMVHDRYENYIECMMYKHAAHPEKGFDVQAFHTSELARGRSLAELLRATGPNIALGLDPELASQEKSLRQMLRVKADYRVTLLSRDYKKEELDSLNLELRQLEQDYKKITETIRTRYPAYQQMTQPTGWDLTQIQEQVIADDQTVLLEYSLGYDKSYVWAVTKDSFRSYTLPSRDRVNESARKVYGLLATAPDSDNAKELPSALQELGRMVLGPVAAELHKRRIIIVADGALHYVPFQVLSSSSADNEPLVANYEVINTPSASILGELRKEAKQRQPKKLLAAWGDPVFDENYTQRNNQSSEQFAALQALEMAPFQQALRDVELNTDSFDPSVIKQLFYAGNELANIRSAAAVGETFVSSGFDATRERLLTADLTQYAILHFATHGLLDPKRPEHSGLVLSTVNRDRQLVNGFVGLHDIYGLRAPVELVVLSACQTALGKDVRGEGLLGLTRGFMYAGASSVIASLWKVDDEATAELMRQSYDNMLRAGMTPAAALRAAQNNIRQRPEWQSPYYWAAFTLQGEYTRVIKPAATLGGTDLYWKIAGGILMLLILASIAAWHHRRRRKAKI